MFPQAHLTMSSLSLKVICFLNLFLNFKEVTVTVGMLAVKLEQMMMVVVLLLAMKHLDLLPKMV